MKKFIWKNIVVILPLIALMFIAEIMLRKVPNDFRVKAGYLNQNAKEIKILILGSSHGYKSFNPSLFSENTFNAAYNAQGIEMDYLLFDKYKSKLSNLKSVILPISYPTLFYEMGYNKNTNWRIFNYNVYYKLNTSINMINYIELLNNLPSISYNKIYDYYVLRRNNVNCDSLGFSPSDKYEEFKTLQNSGMDRVKIESVKLDKNTNLINAIKDRNTDRIKSIANYCEKKKINLFLITTPSYLTYYDNLNPSQLEAMYCFTQKLTKSKHNIFYYDFLKDQRFVANDFHDADHLSRYGAKKITLIMDSIIRSKS